MTKGEEGTIIIGVQIKEAIFDTAQSGNRPVKKYRIKFKIAKIIQTKKRIKIKIIKYK